MHSTVYSAPEDFGLEVVTQVNLETTSNDYGFDFRMVWRETRTGRLLTARDSGCSCPAPFETFHTVEMLDPVDIEELQREVRDISAHEMYYLTSDEALQFISKVRAAM